jgi:hypothetical protein
MGFRQTPLLKAPAEPADLASMGFVTLAPAAGAGAAEAEAGDAETAETEAGEAETAEAGAAAAAPRGQPAKAVAPGAAQRPARPAAGGAAPGGRPAARPATGGGAAATSAATARPDGDDDSAEAPTGTAPSRPAARPAAGGGAAASGAATARPEGDDDSAEAPTGTAPARPAARPAAGVSPRQQRAATSPAARAAGATATATTSPTTSEEEEESPMDTTMQPNDEKVLGAVLGGIASAAVPEVIRMIRRRRKDFAPKAPAAAGPGAGDGDAADAEQKWVAALVRAVAPAAISAAPGIINAIRGRKDVHILPYPGGRPPRPRIPSDWQRPARPGRGPGAPRKDFAAGDGAGEGEEKVLGAVLGGIASAALPEVIRMIRRRRKEFELA